jgi:peptide deformylase
MILPIVTYGHPVLRQKGEPVQRISPEITKLIADMLETMRDARGVGLAAQQVGKALQLTVIDVTGIEDRPSTLELNGQPAAPESLMPLVLLNPVVEPLNEPVGEPEGCLSFPEIYFDVARPHRVAVTAMNEKGETISFTCGGLLARAVQHETDHLNGVLFIDYLSKTAKAKLKPELDHLVYQTRRELAAR